jgi:NAD-dependent SIR2 family protein deacetylase
MFVATANLQPTPTHYFFLLLERHGILRRVFSQNIDTLETIAGLPASKIVEAHGSFATAHCIDCKKSASKEYVLKSGVRKGEVVKCGEEGCAGLVKPDIVFFGEGLPERFFQSLEVSLVLNDEYTADDQDLTICDLLIVIGTSLQVHPFASLPNYVQPHVPRLLINREPVGPFSHLASSRSTKTNGRSLVSMLGSLTTEDKEDDSRDRFWEGDADDGVRRMAQELGWGEELEEMIKEGTERLENGRMNWR